MHSIINSGIFILIVFSISVGHFNILAADLILNILCACVFIYCWLIRFKNPIVLEAKAMQIIGQNEIIEKIDSLIVVKKKGKHYKKFYSSSIWSNLKNSALYR